MKTNSAPKNIAVLILLLCCWIDKVSCEDSPTDCPLIPACCEEDCCGIGTEWVNPLCQLRPGAPGWQGFSSYSSEYESGCIPRVCCEDDCCGPGTVYDDDSDFCTIGSSPPPSPGEPTTPAPVPGSPIPLTPTPSPEGEPTTPAPVTGSPIPLTPPGVVSFDPTNKPSQAPSNIPSTSNAPSETCTYRRRDIDTLTPAEQQELADLIEQHVSAPVIQQHFTPGIHHTPRFLPWHRGYIEGLENFLNTQPNGANYVLLPKWDPQDPVPGPLLKIDLSCLNVVPPQACGTLPPQPGGLAPLPPSLAGDNVCDFPTATAMQAVLELWHDGIHDSVGGAFADVPTATHLLLFLVWHAFVDDIYWCYCQCGDCSMLTDEGPGLPEVTVPADNSPQPCLQEVRRFAEEEFPRFGVDSTRLVQMADEAISIFAGQQADVVDATIAALEDLRQEAAALPIIPFFLGSFDQRIELCSGLLSLP